MQEPKEDKLIVVVYALHCNGDIFYIGCTNGIYARYKAHMLNALKLKCGVKLWDNVGTEIRLRVEQGYVPNFMILDICYSFLDGYSKESDYICNLRHKYNLTNHQNNSRDRVMKVLNIGYNRSERDIIMRIVNRNVKDHKAKYGSLTNAVKQEIITKLK